MTLHWWMHWFWITRPRAVATQLILLLAAVQTLPLPASTLDPQVSSIHNSRIPVATDSYSEKDTRFENHKLTRVYIEKDTGLEDDKLTSVYNEQHRQTVVYEEGPVWSNSPDIEEPFYPTTASSDGLLSRDSSTDNIPITSRSISNDELQTETHLFNYFGKSHMDNENPIELTSQYFSDQSSQSSDIVQSYGSVGKSDDSLHKANTESANTQEKTSVEEINSSTETHFISTTPKIIDIKDSEIINNHKSSNTPESPNTESDSLDDKVSSLNSVSTSYVKKGNQRLVIRDLSNLSEPVLSSVVASQGNNSSNIENASRPNPRASKAIGSFPNFSSSSVDGKQGHIFRPEKFEGSGKLVHTEDDKENKTILHPDDLKSSDSQINNTSATQINNNSTPSSLHNNTKDINNETKSEILNNRKLPLESGSSKLAPELSNKSVHSINITSLRKIQTVNRTEQPISLPINSTENTSSNSSAVDSSKSVQRHLHSSESPVPVDSNLSQRFTTLSDTEESGNLTPAHSHEFIGRSASLSHDTETTVEPSIAPVSRSRLAASPQDVPHTGLDAASITGIALGIVVFAGLTGAVSFVLYRRRYLNKPQTLNDKCSNPDSSGYIDDSTLRDNSEEMYSLDNDSFLNSLEAMTIQNYWTDNVKHTKL